MDRTTIVKNGCAGSCCECFILHYSKEDLMLMKEAKENNQRTFINTQGVIQKKIYSPEIQQVHDMIIPLGLSTTDPATGRPLADQIEEEGLGFKLDDPEKLKEEG